MTNHPMRSIAKLLEDTMAHEPDEMNNILRLIADALEPAGYQLSALPTLQNFILVTNAKGERWSVVVKRRES